MHFVERNDDIFEESHMFVSKRHSEPGDNTGEDVEQLSSTIELVRLMDEGIEALIHCLSNHLSSGHQLGVELVKDVLQVIALHGLLCVEQIKEFLDERGCYIDFELSDLDRVVHDQIEEKLVNFLQMRPCWVHILLLLDTSLSEVELGTSHIGQRSEDVFLDHLHD